MGFTGCGKSRFAGGPFKLCLSGVHLEDVNVPHSSQKRLEWATVGFVAALKWFFRSLFSH
jgi:hypothetical protein